MVRTYVFIFWYLALIPLTLAESAGSLMRDNLQKLNEYYVLDNQAVHDADILKVAQAIVNKRSQFSDVSVAKAFSLLSSIAFNRGDVVTALQFAQFGTEINTADIPLNLDLLMKIARGYYLENDYVKLQETAKKAIELAEQIESKQYRIQAIAYSTAAHASKTNYAQAISQLSQVEQLLENSPEQFDQILLLEIIAKAHFNLSGYENSIELLNKVLNLRISMNKLKGISYSYILLARAYFQIEKYDDAYNAFWQAKRYGDKDEADILIAYAELGLGEVLLKQKKLIVAKKQLTNAIVVFEKSNLTNAKLSTQIALIKVLYLLKESAVADTLLLDAQLLAKKMTLSVQQIELYSLLTEYYVEQNQFKKAIEFQSEYLSYYKRMFPMHKENSANLLKAIKTREKSQQIALNMIEKSELNLRFSNKFERQNIIILLLTSALIILLLIVLYWRWQNYRQLSQDNADEDEILRNRFAKPAQTKHWYQLQYKMARKYRYNIAIGYLVIENWQELSFHFNDKVLADVSASIASIITGVIEEEDYAGLISAGEYLILCPHQSNKQMEVKLQRILEAINIRFFANLGEHVVNISYVNESPSIQDIDPYVFLSRLSDNAQLAVNFQK